MSEKPIVVGVGELLWDLYPDRRRPGGAPANVAFHAQQLGLAGVVFSRVGQDELGRELCAHLESSHLSTRFVQRDPHHRTGEVTVDLSSPQNPVFTIQPDAAWDYLELNDAARALAADASAICFGTLAQRSPQSRATIRGLLSLADSSCLTVYDVNFRPPFYEKAWIEESLKLARIVKLNGGEVLAIAELLNLKADDPIGVARQFQANYAIELVCVTRGADGCILIDRTGVAEAEGVEIEGVDPVGAGDAFTAGLICGELHHWSLQVKAEFANQIAALVASREGAMPKLDVEFEETVARYR